MAEDDGNQGLVPLARRSSHVSGRLARGVIDEIRAELALGLRRVVAVELEKEETDADCRTDVIWQRVWDVARSLGRDTMPLLVAEHRRVTGEEGTALRRQLAAGHWWCEAVMCAVGRLEREGHWNPRVPGELGARLERQGARLPDRDDPVPPEVARLAAAELWTKIGSLARVNQPLGFLRAVLALRTLGGFMCRAPENHRSVVRRCLWPMARSLPDGARLRLRTSFPAWLGDASEGVLFRS